MAVLGTEDAVELWFTGGHHSGRQSLLVVAKCSVPRLRTAPAH